MHHLKLFPNYRLLERLVDNPLNHGQNLTTAMRRWALLNWFYGDAGQNTYLGLPGGLTFNQWCEDFFKLEHPQISNHPQGILLEKIESINQSHNSQCYCYKTTKDWLSFYDFSVIEWQVSLESKISVSKQIVQQSLQERLFAKTRRTLQNDINFLQEKKCLKIAKPLYGKLNEIYLVEKLPDWVEENPTAETQSNPALFPGLSPTELADLAQALDMLAFLDPKLEPIAERISEEVSGTRRVFLHVDYVVPKHIHDEVDNLQEELQQKWRKNQVQPISFDYASARFGKKKCIVYPVCIYYVQRAKYLCGYGQNPDGKLDWYNYRLERIQFEDFLDWEDMNIPDLLREQYVKETLPNPSYIEQKMQEAWGFDFYNASELMLLRFNDDFHQRHIKDTFRHETFTLVESRQQIFELIKQHVNNAQEQECLTQIVKGFPKDKYYTAKYRVDDNNVIMRLRAWGANVEVLFPGELRDRMSHDIQETAKLYEGGSRE
jgi:CRISPR-associated protein (TIGR03985 family)